MLAEATLTSARAVAPSGHVVNPLDPARPVRAVLFDVDGTLYRQRPVRISMAAELAVLALRRPLSAPTVFRVVAEYRRAQETLRRRPRAAETLEQLTITAKRTGLSVERVEAIVGEWMVTRPLKYLARYRAGGLVPLLDFLGERRIQTGVLSDYPARQKLEALGISDRFSVVLSACDAAVGTFKPHPRGFLAAAERWALHPSEVLVVGDREDADAAGAAAAGMSCVIIGGSARAARANCLSLSSFERLRDVLDHNQHNR